MFLKMTFFLVANLDNTLHIFKTQYISHNMTYIDWHLSVTVIMQADLYLFCLTVIFKAHVLYIIFLVLSINIYF